MIEYGMRKYKNQAWTHTFPDIVPRPIDFDNLKFRINGVVYTDWNDEFEKAVIWSKLQSA